MPPEQTATLATPDGHVIHTRAYIPNNPRAALMVVHGYGEHSGRYDHVIECLTAQKYAVYTQDHRGHGKSSGVRAYCDRFDCFIEDLKQHFDHMAAQQPTLKRFLLGHSMGALISVRFALRYQDELAGMIVSGVPLALQGKVSPILQAFARAVNLVFPKMQYISMPGGATLTRDQTVLSRLGADPLAYHGNVRVRMGLQIGAAAADAAARLSDLRLPMLILHGSADEIAPPLGSQWLYDRAASTDKTLKIYDGLYHEVMNEPEKDIVLNDILSWLAERR